MILLRALNCLVPWRIHRQNFLLKAQRGQIPLDSNSHSVEVRPDTKSESGLVDGFPSMNISPARDTCTVFISFIMHLTSCQRVITLFLQTLAFYYVNDVKIHTSENLKDLGSYFLKKRPLNPPCGSKIILISILPNLAPPRLSFRFCDSGAMLILHNGQPPTTLLSQLRGSYCLYVCIIVTRRSQSSTIAPCLGFWIPFRGLWIPGAGFHSFSV